MCVSSLSCALIKKPLLHLTQRNAPVIWNKERRSGNNVGLFRSCATASKTHTCWAKEQHKMCEQENRQTQLMKMCMWKSMPEENCAPRGGGECVSLFVSGAGQLLLLAQRHSDTLSSFFFWTTNAAFIKNCSVPRENSRKTHTFGEARCLKTTFCVKKYFTPGWLSN